MEELKKVLAEQKTIYIEYDAVLSGQPRRLLSKNTLDLSSGGIKFLGLAKIGTI